MRGLLRKLNKKPLFISWSEYPENRGDENLSSFEKVIEKETLKETEAKSYYARTSLQCRI
jgi:hypothetical protein